MTLNLIIKIFKQFKELNDIYSSLKKNEFNNLSCIQKLFHKLTIKKNKDKIIIELINEIKKEITNNNKKDIFEKVIEKFITSLNNQKLFKAVKLLGEKCHNCRIQKSNILYYNFSLIDLRRRLFNHDKSLFLIDFFKLIELNENYIHKWRKSNNNKYFLKADYIYLPQILVIILIYNKDFNEKNNIS